MAIISLYIKLLRHINAVSKTIHTDTYIVNTTSFHMLHCPIFKASEIHTINRIFETSKNDRFGDIFRRNAAIKSFCKYLPNQ